LVVTVWRRQGPPVVVVGCCVAFLGVVRLGTMRWERWIIPILTVLAVFAAAAVVQGAPALAELQRPTARRSAAPITAVGALVGISIAPARSLVALDRAADNGTT